MQLPKPISSWVEIISCFPEDVSGLIISLVDRLSHLVNSVPVDEAEGIIEPDGLDGVGRLVQYERLILSEWVLQEEIPEEFIRRAVSAEHLFNELKRHENKENRHCYALFDCGPDQLGKPRLVQLAIIILLARRAEKNNAHFFWGVLQDDKRKLFEGVTREGILYWLGQRSIDFPCHSSIAGWFDIFLKQGGELISPSAGVNDDRHGRLKDFWLVSQSDFKIPTDNARKVFIEESKSERNKITVEVKSSNSSRKISLNLPQEDVNVKIIRNPFAVVKKAVISYEKVSDGVWVVSPNGRLFGYISNHEIHVNNIDINDQQQKEPCYTFSLPEGQSCLSMHITKRRAAFLCADYNYFYIYNYPVPGKVKKIVKRQSIQLPDGAGRLLSMIISRGDAESETLYVLDCKGHLRALDISSGETLFKTTSQDVVALGAIVNCDYYVEFDRERSKLTLCWYLSSRKMSSRSFFLEGRYKIPRFHISGSGDWRKGSIGCIAFEVDENTWTLITNNEKKEIIVQEDDVVIGAWAGEYGSENEGDVLACTSKGGGILIVLKSDRMTLCAVYDDELFLCRLSSDFVVGELNPRHPFLHYINQDKEMVIVDVFKGIELLRLPGPWVI
ncbi:hypothetical protein [Microbulbifer guangxiensis]|uniref:hypothetical protein n=1 Tax=Microbulbifer guangxiensis TaxID=2904249 RepID=UPI001F1ADC16|nr:hypothetical protein [Microbulbifer guangxiensis]